MIGRLLPRAVRRRGATSKLTHTDRDVRSHADGTAPAHGTLGPTAKQWLLAVRLPAGAVFVLFGLDKFTSHTSEVASFRTYGLPLPELVVYLVGGLELVGGLLLLAGLFVRGVALALAGDMVGAIVISGLGRGELISFTLAPSLLAAMVVLIRYGGGAWSLDQRLRSPS